MVDHYWGSMNYVSSLIKASELKAGFLLSFYGILLNVIFRSVDRIGDSGQGDIVLYILIGAWFLVTAISIYFCVRCFVPRIEGTYDPNLFFFGDAITKFGDIKQFAATFYEVSLDEQRLFAQLGEQIFIVSKISASKFKNVQQALQFLGVGLVLLLLAVAWYAVGWRG